VIIGGGARSNWRFFGRHLMDTDKNETVRLVEFRGLASDTPLEALREMDALASGTSCKRFFYHASLNTRADEMLTPEQWEQAVDRLEKELGLVGHSRFIVTHEKEQRQHYHVVWSRINPDTMRAVSDSNNYARHETAARDIEAMFAHAPVRSTLIRETHEKRPERLPKNWEQFRGKKSGVSPQEVKAEVSALWRATTGGEDFAAALEEKGYILCRGDRRDFCIVDAAGDEHSLARRIEGAKAAEIRERLQNIDREALPIVAEACILAKARSADPAPSMEQETEVKQDIPPLPSQELAESLNPVDRDIAHYAAQFEARGHLVTVPPLVPGWENPQETLWGKACRLGQRMHEAFEHFYDKTVETVRSWRHGVAQEREAQKDFEIER
jgi:hypothetical protein